MMKTINRAVLAAMAFGIIGTSGAVAQNKSDTIKPNPPVEEIKQPAQSSEFEIPGKGQIIDRGKPTPPTAREATPTPVEETAAPPSAEWEDPRGGQHLIRGNPKPPVGARRKGPKVRDKPASNTSRLLTIGGLAGLAGLIAVVASGDGAPASR